jgi:hypothetical protein
MQDLPAIYYLRSFDFLPSSLLVVCNFRSDVVQNKSATSRMYFCQQAHDGTSRVASSSKRNMRHNNDILYGGNQTTFLLGFRLTNSQQTKS